MSNDPRTNAQDHRQHTARSLASGLTLDTDDDPSGGTYADGVHQTSRVRRGRRGARLAATATAVTLVAAALLGGAGTASAADRSASYERGVTVTINKARAAAGGAPVRVVRCADSLAESLASRMRRQHRTLRVAPTKVEARCGRPLVLQAASITRDGARKLVRGWLRHHTVRRLALGGRSRSVGVGAVRDRSGRWYVSLLLVGAAPGSDGTADSGSLDTSDGADAGDSTGGTSDSGGTSDGSTGDGTSDGGTGDGTSDGTDDSTAALGSAILTETNSRRAEHGLAPLQASTCATNFATEHSRRMAEEGSFEHADLGDLQRQCIAQGVAENIAASSSMDASTLLDLWMASAMHRANILDPALTHLGVGVAQDPATGRWYATQDFLALA